MGQKEKKNEYHDFPSFRESFQQIINATDVFDIHDIQRIDRDNILAGWTRRKRGGGGGGGKSDKWTIPA